MVPECGDHAHCSPFAPGTSQAAVGLLPFCILLFIIWPNSTVYAVIFSPLYLVSLYFVAGGEVCPGADTTAKSPGSQPISLIYHKYPKS